MEMRIETHRDTDREHEPCAVEKPEPGSLHDVLWGWDRCPSSDSCQPPGMMGTQQVQRRGRKLKGNLRKQPGVGCPSQTLGPVPSRPFSDPPRHKHTYACFPGPAWPAWTRQRGHHPCQAERTEQGRNQASNRRTECARWIPHPQSPYPEANICL